MPSFAWIESLLRKALPDKFALFNTTNTAKTSGLWQRRALSTKFNQALKYNKIHVLFVFIVFFVLIVFSILVPEQ